MITAIQTDWGNDPRILRIVTTDSFYTITQAGYLTAQATNIIALQNGNMQFNTDDVCLISYLGGEGFFTVDATVNDTFISLQGSPLTGNYAKVPVALTPFLAQYTTPVPILAAVANSIIVIQNWALEWKYGSAALVGGGAMSLQYNATDHSGGIIATNTIAAADLTGLSASAIEYSAGGLLPIEVLTNVTNVGIYLSNPTAAFTAGTGGSAVVHVWYSIITA